MLAWTANRPVSLVRCPQGRAKTCFFQKHDSGSFGQHVLHVPIDEKKGEIGSAHVCTPVTNAHLVCRLMLETKKQPNTTHITLHSYTSIPPTLSLKNPLTN